MGRDRRLVATSGSSWAASAAVVPSSGPPWTTTPSRRSSISGRTSISTSLGHADLGEPEAVLLDEVEREHVAAGRADDVDGQLDVDRRARRHRVRERGPHAVPDDRVAARVEPVVGELQPVVAAGAPGRAAGVLEHEPCRPARAGA